VSEFRKLLLEKGGLSPEVADQVVRFRDLVVDENTRQNLTRLTTPEDFFEGHVVDCLELLKWGAFEYPVLDIGSGGGVPGLLCALLSDGSWILSDSEGHKAAFLERAVAELGLNPDRIRVFSGRAEDYLKKNRVGTVTARAVGPVTRIYAWIRSCSTWNTLVLFKGPGWDEEWKQAALDKAGKELKVTGSHDYRVGPEQKTRKLIHLTRVPRGT